MSSVFISYNHLQGDWVCKCLVPSLKAGGARIYVDYERFKAGKCVFGQMDVVQDRARVQVLILSQGYLKSEYCLHEMNRAIDKDPLFQKGVVIPVLRDDCDLPDRIRQSNPLHIDLRVDWRAEPWDQLLSLCGADLGATVPDWLRVRDEVHRQMELRRPVNLVTDEGTKWRELIQDVRTRSPGGLGVVDLQRGATASRRALLEEILRACGIPADVPGEPPGEDLVTFDRRIAQGRPVRLAFLHFDLVPQRKHYDVDLFCTIAHHLRPSLLVPLIQSRIPYKELLPPVFSDQHRPVRIKTVELRGRSKR